MTLPLLKVDDPTLQFNFDEIAKKFLDAGGRQVKVRFGSTTAAFAAAATSSEVTVTHGMGSTPVAVYATGEYVSGTFGPVAVGVRNGSINSTTFKLSARATAGETPTSNVTLYWLAVG